MRFKATYQTTDGANRPAEGAAEIKLLPNGQVEFYAAVFKNVDLVGDRIIPGAFTKTLKAWAAKEKPIPVVFSHKWDSAFDIIGWANPMDCTQDAKGLLIRAQLDIDTNPTALQVFNLMKRFIVNEASFAYDVPPGGERRAKDGANELLVMDILEVGPCLKGANPMTETVNAKSLHPATVEQKQILEGSVEETQVAVAYAITEKFSQEAEWTSIEGTYTDHAIVAVAKTLEDEPRHYMVPFTSTTNGIVLGKSREVELEPVAPVQEKAMDAKKFAWTDSDGNGHIPIDTEGQVRAAINLASNNWTFRGNHMNPAPPADERAAVVGRIRAAADKFGIDTDLGGEKTSETDSGEATGGDGKSPVVEPDYGKEKSLGEITFEIISTGTEGDGTSASFTLRQKAGARNSRSDQERIQAAHDATVAAGAMCAMPDDVETKAPSTDEDDVEMKTADESETKAEEAAPDVDPSEYLQKRIDYLMAQAKFFNVIGDTDGELEMLALIADERAKSGNDARQAGKPADDEKAADAETKENADGDKPNSEDADDEESDSAKKKGMDAGEEEGPSHDGDEYDAADPEEEKKPLVADKKSAPDAEDATASAKTDEPDTAKVDERAETKTRALADVADLEAFLKLSTE